MPAYIATGIVNSNVWSGELRFAEFANWADRVSSTIPKQDILNSIDYPKGAAVDVEYENTTKSGGSPELPMSILTVTKLTIDDGRGNAQEINYGYGGGKMYLAQGPRERKFSGFATTTETYSDKVITRYFNQGDTVNTSIGEQTDGYGQIGKVFREDIVPVGSTTPLKRTYWKNESVNYLGLTQSVSTSSTNYALDLEYGSNQYATAADSTSMDVTGDLTLEFWINPESTNLSRHLLSKFNTGSDMGYILYHTGGGSLDLAINPSSNSTVDKGVAWSFTLGTWQHIMATYNASTGEVKFYKNCSQQGSTQTGYPNNIKNSTGPFGIGINYDNPSFSVDGMIDDVRVWNKVKSVTECSSDYQTEITASSTLNGYWKVNNDYLDSSGNSNTLTAFNSPTFSTSTPFSGGYSSATSSDFRSNFFVTATKELVQDYDSSGSHKDGAVEYNYATTTGDLLSVVEKGEVLGSDAGTYTDTGSDKRTTTYGYADSGAINLRLPKQKTIANNGGTRIAESLYTYDNLTFGTTSLGNLTKQEDWIESTTYASTTSAYNSYGLATSTKDQRSNQTVITYDSYNLYPATVTNALSQSTAYTYDYASGKTKTKIDPNNLAFEWTYDPVGRITAEKQPDLTSTSTSVTSTAYTYTDGSFPSKVQITKHLSSATSSDIYRYFDGLGRTISERAEATGDNTYVVKDFVYNSASRLDRETLPYFASSTSFSSATSTTALFTTYTYDGLDRILNVYNIVGTTTTAYGPWTATTTDARGNYKGFVKDAYGNLVQVLEKNNASLYSTSYTYDLNNNLTKITDALGNIRNFTYDGLNRRLTAEDLHASADSTFGTYYFAYDLTGNIASSTDPKAQNIVFTYDGLNRLLTENYTGSAGTEVTYTYDYCTYGKGKLCIASSTGAFATTTYNALGLPATATTTIGGTSYGIFYSYDRQGNIVTMYYPTGAQVRYNHNSAGQLDSTEFKAATSTSSYSSAISSTTYAPTGLPSYRMYGSGVPMQYTYDQSELYRLRSIVTGATSTAGATTSTNTYALDLEADSTQYTSASDSASLSITGDLSIEIWINPETSLSGLGRHFVNKSSSGTDESFILYHTSSDNLDLMIRPSSGSAVDKGVSMTFDTGSWQHLMATYKASTGDVKFYKNCVQQGSTQTGYPANIKDSTGSLNVGINNDNLNAPFDGKVDDVRIWSKVRSASECLTDYQSEVAASSSLKAYWKFNNTYTDSSGNSNTATAVNSPTFSLSTPFSGGTLSQTNSHQNLYYNYDAVGNITKITDLSTTTAAKVTNYTYDDLNRLTHAESLTATSTPYDYYYGYDAVGNLSSSTPNGTFAYATTTAGYSNPHAPLYVASSTLTYDTNGNLTAYSTTSSYTWDYRNRITQIKSNVASSTAAATSTFNYNQDNQRTYQIVKATTTATSTTHYPNKYSSKVSSISGANTLATTTNYIYAGDTLIATIEQKLYNNVATGTPQTYFYHPDHLGSTNVVTSATGTILHTLDYYPYGAQRINRNITATKANRQYIGQFTDSATSLSYLQNRYMDPTRGQFMSQDLSHLALGNPAQLKQITGQDQQMYLLDPQQLNSYSYARGNPIRFKDPNGNALPFLAIPAAGALLEWIGFGFTAKSVIGTFESAYTNLVLPVRYKDSYSSEERKSAPYKFTIDATMNWSSGSVPSRVGRISVDSLLWFGEYLPYQGGENTKINVPLSPYTTFKKEVNSSIPMKNSVGASFSSNSSVNRGFSSSQNQAVRNIINVASQSKGVNFQSFLGALDQVISAFSSTK